MKKGRREVNSRSDFSPCFGERGRLSERGDKVQCHACGAYFTQLARHVTAQHGLSANAYRKEFGLPTGFGLCCARLSTTRAARAIVNLGTPDYTLHDRRIKEKPCAVCGRPIQFRTKNQASALLEACSVACRGILIGSRLQGRPLSEAHRRRLVSMNANSAWNHRGVTEEQRTCAHCGREFTLPFWSKRRTCSSSCNKGLRSTISSQACRFAEHKAAQADRTHSAISSRLLSGSMTRHDLSIALRMSTEGIREAIKRLEQLGIVAAKLVLRSGHWRYEYALVGGEGERPPRLSAD